MDRWSGRVALVTGASSGIGAVIAKRLVKCGMKVVGCGQNIQAIYPTADKLKNDKGELYPIQCNLRKEEEIMSMFSEIKKKFGGVDVCLNVAGVWKASTLIEGETEHWRNMWEVNVLALSICTREAIKSMRERGVDDGHIVHCNSIGGHIYANYPEASMYITSKHAVTALTEQLRMELRLKKSNTRISSISPGLTTTDLFRKAGLSDTEKFYDPKTPALTSEQVAESVIYILSCPPEVQVHDILIRPTGQDH